MTTAAGKTKAKCGFPPCDNTATHQVFAGCKCGHRRLALEVCGTHLPECEATARSMLEPHFKVTVVELPRVRMIANIRDLLRRGGC